MQIRVVKLKLLVAVSKSETWKSSEAAKVVKAVAGAKACGASVTGPKGNTVTVTVEPVGQ